MDKLELLFWPETQGKRDWKLYNEWKPVLMGLKYAFADMVKAIYYDELASINYKKNERWYDYPLFLMVFVVIIKLVDNCPYMGLAKELSLILRPELDIHIHFSILSRRMSKIDIGEFLKDYKGENKKKFRRLLKKNQKNRKIRISLLTDYKYGIGRGIIQWGMADSRKSNWSRYNEILIQRHDFSICLDGSLFEPPHIKARGIRRDLRTNCLLPFWV